MIEHSFVALKFWEGVGKYRDILIPREYPFYSDVGQKVSCNKGCLNKKERNRTTLNNYLFFLCALKFLFCFAWRDAAPISQKWNNHWLCALHCSENSLMLKNQLKQSFPWHVHGFTECGTVCLNPLHSNSAVFSFFVAFSYRCLIIQLKHFRI